VPPDPVPSDAAPSDGGPPDGGPPDAAPAQPPAGLAGERTALAWQRTGLSLLVGSTLLARLLHPVIGAVALGGFGVCWTLTVWVMLVRRPHPGAGEPGDLLPRDGLPAAALVLAVAALGVTELLGLAARH